MRVEKIGKRQFAFDLLWEKFRGDAAEVVRTKLDEEPGYFTAFAKPNPSKKGAAKLRALFAALRARFSPDTEGDAENSPESTLGYGEGAFKGSVYSYAQALAKLDRDGFYLLQVGEDKYWYAVIMNGRVVPSTDRTVNGEKAWDAARNMPRTFAIPVFSSTDIVKDAHHFDPVKAVEKVKLAPMRQLGKQENVLLGVLVLAAVIGAIGFGGWHFLFKGKDASQEQAQAAARQRDSYLASAKAAFDELPTEAVWAAEAYRTAVTTFTSNLAGWSLEGFTCTPAGCTATYVLADDVPAYAISPLYALYGRERVDVNGDQRSLSVRLALEPPPAMPATDTDVESPAPERARLLDTIGRLGMQFGEIIVDGQPTTESLNAAYAAPAAMPVLQKDTVKTKHESAMDLVRLRLLSSYMAESGFVATTFTVTGGAGAIKPAWNITWVRIHGGEV